MPFVLANGVNIHYQELGQGPAIVMIHGLLLDNLALWYFTAGRIVGGHRRALMYDLRGHGKSDKTPSGFDLATLSQDLSDLVAGLAPGEAIDLCGFSYGCLVALRYAIDHPAHIRRLVLVDAPLPPMAIDADRWLQADRDTLIAALPQSLRQSVMKAPGLALKLLQRASFLALRTTLIEDIKREPAFSSRALASMTAPCLCIYGDQSEFRDDGERLAAALPNTTLRLLSGGHRLLNECAPAVTSLVGEFLNG
jgi:pimeloyl-ACP methyl ester carboxylesterase